jgi:RHS repeat-associated protein
MSPYSFTQAGTTYDALGRRVARTASGSTTVFVQVDQQYSIVACTDSTGAATERYDYTVYGLPTVTDGSGTVRTSSAIGNRYTYTGREWDGVLGLYHYRARMYEATVGRFCSRDPMVIWVRTLISLN